MHSLVLLPLVSALALALVLPTVWLMSIVVQRNTGPRAWGTHFTFRAALNQPQPPRSTATTAANDTVTALPKAA